MSFRSSKKIKTAKKRKTTAPKTRKQKTAAAPKTRKQKTAAAPKTSTAKKQVNRTSIILVQIGPTWEI